MVTKERLLSLLRGARGVDFNIVCDTLLKSASQEDLDAICGELHARAKIIGRIKEQLHWWEVKTLNELLESTAPEEDDEGIDG